MTAEMGPDGLERAATAIENLAAQAARHGEPVDWIRWVRNYFLGRAAELRLEAEATKLEAEAEAYLREHAPKTEQDRLTAELVAAAEAGAEIQPVLDAFANDPERLARAELERLTAPVTITIIRALLEDLLAAAGQHLDPCLIGELHDRDPENFWPLVVAAATRPLTIPGGWWIRGLYTDALEDNPEPSLGDIADGALAGLEPEVEWSSSPYRTEIRNAVAVALHPALVALVAHRCPHTTKRNARCRNWEFCISHDWRATVGAR